MRVAAIVHGEVSGIVRRVVVADSIEELGAGKHYGEGEGIIIVTPEQALKFDPEKKRIVPSLGECYGLVAEKRGKPSESDRCIVVDDATGEIAEVVLADPYLEADRSAWAGKTLFQHDQADIGWALDGAGEWKAPAIERVPADESEATVEAKTES